MRKMKRFLSILLCVTMLLSCIGTTSFAENSTTDIFTIDSLEQYVVHSEILETDGYIGIPVGVKTYIQDADSTATTADTELMLYVVNTNTANIGKGDDETIIKGMLDRGFIVVVLDYFNQSEAVTPDLDWSVQEIRMKLNSDSSATSQLYTDSAQHSEYSYVIPQGYDITLKQSFWSIDKHGADGTLDYIVNVWNNDFLGVYGNETITFEQDTTISGVEFKAGDSMTVAEYTAKLPEGKVTSIFECINKDGTLVDMDVYMDIIYPVNPDEEVPVMMYASSGEASNSTWNMAKRPHLSGFLFSGYAAVCYDYAYVPMGRGDHYGYFDGNGAGSVGGVTGDNYTYSVSIYNSNKVDTAAVRKVRYMVEEDSATYNFNMDKVGVIGISKSGVVTKLGYEHPEKLQESRIFEGHSGETRYEAGNPDYLTDIDGATGTIHAAEEQPWLTYKGTDTSIRSNVEFVYASVGGWQETITSNHAPMYIVGTMAPNGSYYDFYPRVMSYCYTNDVPIMDYVCESVGHDFGTGPDKETGNDTYQALFDCANYWLLNASVKCEYIKPLDGADYVSATDVITVKFNATVPMEEVTSKVTIVNDTTGEEVQGIWKASYGNTLYEFTPYTLKGGFSYTVTVPKTVLGENGKAIATEESVTFTVAREKTVDAVNVSTGSTLSYGESMFFHFDDLDFSNSKTTSLRFSVMNDAANVVEVYLATLEEGGSYTIADTPIGEVNLCGAGEYDFDVTEYVNSLDGGKAAFCLKTKKEAGETVVSTVDFESDTVGDTASSILGVEESSYAELEISDELDATTDKGKSMKLTGVKPYTKYSTYHTFYSGKTTLFTFMRAIKTGNLTAEDYGRKFQVKFSVYDTIERKINASVGDETKGSYGSDIDLRATRLTYLTVANQWTDYTFDFTIDNPLHYTTLQKKNISLSVDNHGANTGLYPMYVDDLTVTEIITDVEIGSVGSDDVRNSLALVMHPVETQAITPSDFAYVESGDNADNVMSNENGVSVSGQSLTVGDDTKKVYIKLSLANYVSGPIYFEFDTTEASKGKLSVFGISDVEAAANWSSETITYLNAPANDRLSNGVNLDMVYGGASIADYTINGVETYTVDITNYATSMKEKGAEYLTLIFTVDGDHEKVTLTEDFESSDVVTINGGGGLTNKGKTTDEDHTTGSGQSYYMRPSTYNYERLVMNLLGDGMTESDAGRSFRITFWAKSNATGKFQLSIMPHGTYIQNHKLLMEVPTANQWKQYTYEFTLTADDLVASPRVALAMSDFTIDGMKYLYIDDIVVEEVGLGTVTIIPNAGVATDKVVSSETFDDWTGASISWKGDTYSGTNYYMRSGFSDNNVVTVAADVNASSGEGKSIKFSPDSDYCRLKFYGIFDSLQTKDIGRTLNISFKTKVTAFATGETSASFEYGLMSGFNRTSIGDDKDYSANFYGEKGVATIAENELNQWKTWNYTVTIDENMLLQTFTVSGTERESVGIGLLSIVSTGLASGATMYIDDIIVTEALEDVSEPVYETFDDWTSASHAWKGDTYTGTNYYLRSGFNNSSIVTLVTDVDATSGEGKSIKFSPDQTYNRLKFYGMFRSLSQKDIGKTFTISFKTKVTAFATGSTSASFTYGLMSGFDRRSSTVNDQEGGIADAKDYSSNIYDKTGNGVAIIVADELNQWKTWTFDVTIDANMLGRDVTNNYGTYEDVGIGLLGIISTGLGSGATMYIDDLYCSEVVEGAGNSILAPEANVAIGGNGNVSTSVLSVQSAEANETPQGIKKAYLKFEGDSEYKYTQKATLNLEVSDCTSQTLKVYGLTNVAYPNSLTYNTAPGSKADESMDYTKLYGGNALAEIKLNGAGAYAVDVTDYLRAYAENELVFVVATEDAGGTEYVNLNFEDFTFNKDVDYISEGVVTVTNGVVNVTGNTITLLNVFGNGVSSKAGNKYIVSADVMAESGKTITASVINSEGTVVATKSVDATGEVQTVEFEFNSETVADRIQITTTAESFTLDNVVVKDQTVVTIAGASIDAEIAEEPVADIVGTLMGTTLSLEGNIAINFWVSINETYKSSETAYMQFTLPNGDVTKIYLKDTTTNSLEGGTVCNIFTADVAAKEMTGNIKAQLFKDTDVTGSPVYNYTIQQYADVIMKNESGSVAYTNAQPLVKAMLNYGAYAQLHFGYNTGNLANTGYELPEIANVTADMLENSGCNTGLTSGDTSVSLAGTGLILESETTLKFYFKVADDVTGVTFTCGGKTLETKKSGSYTCVEITNIPAKDLDKNYTVEISYDGGSTTASYNCIAYCHDVLDWSGEGYSYTDELKDLLRALYIYNVKANDYFPE